MVAIVLHLYYQDLWNEFKSKIIPLLNENVHLYITVNDESEYIDDMKNFAKELFILKNKGMDFGPFVYIWDLIKDRNYDYVLKLHGKKSEVTNKRWHPEYGKTWRLQLVNSLIISPDKFNSVLDYMKNNEQIYMAGSQAHFIDKERELINSVNRTACLLSIQKLLKKINAPEHGCFFAGSMFMVKTEYLNKLFDGCDLKDLYEDFEDYYSSAGETLAHGLERVIGYGVEKYDGKYLILESN